MERSKKILFVDDDESTRRLYSDALISLGYSVECASDGFEAIKNISNTRFDAIVSDIGMPGLDGIGLYLRVVKDFPHLKDRFFFITGDIEATTLLKSLERDYLTKPFKMSELANLLSKITPFMY